MITLYCRFTMAQLRAGTMREAAKLDKLSLEEQHKLHHFRPQIYIRASSPEIIEFAEDTRGVVRWPDHNKFNAEFLSSGCITFPIEFENDNDAILFKLRWSDYLVDAPDDAAGDVQ